MAQGKATEREIERSAMRADARATARAPALDEDGALAALEQGKDPLCIIRDPAKQAVKFPQKSSMMQDKQAGVSYALGYTTATGDTLTSA